MRSPATVSVSSVDGSLSSRKGTTVAPPRHMIARSLTLWSATAGRAFATPTTDTLPNRSRQAFLREAVSASALMGAMELSLSAAAAPVAKSSSLFASSAETAVLWTKIALTAW